MPHETSQRPSAVESTDMTRAEVLSPSPKSPASFFMSVPMPPLKETITGLNTSPETFFSFIDFIAPKIIEPYLCSKFQNGAKAYFIESLLGSPP